MFNKLGRLSPAFEGHTLFDGASDNITSIATMSVVSNGDSGNTNKVFEHGIFSNTFQAKISDDGFLLYAWGWDVRFNINLSSIPERARYGKISFTAIGYARDGTSGGSREDVDKSGRTQYRNASGSFVDLLSPYGMGSGEGKYPGDCSFITTDSVNDYIENQGGILQLRLRHTGTGGFGSGGWYGGNSVSDDIRISKIEIVGA